MRDRTRTSTREALLRAAEQTFAEKGIDGARIEDIAALAQVAVGTIYNYFGNSGDLAKALILERRRGLVAHLDRALSEARRRRASWPEQVESFVRATLDCTRAHLPFYAILLQCENRKTPSPMVGLSSELYTRAEDLVQVGVNQRFVRKSDASILPAILVMMCRAPLLHLRQMGAGAWNEAVTGQLVRFFCAAAASASAPPASARGAPAAGRRVRRSKALEV
jgi:AcrR family transcriptional regulator